ncbi:quinone-dependent dihydroorotate dehydrogenase [Brevundimonas sp. A19_0]|uniref:quinone-dependent dihydroorotate dehydrogenase n=1 Tax=Brevundimonas sp. A19_0 TaxID=2821087 RepID=UPI001ADD58F0|nr:quinone-dependent dihydroorotate dehydrogenase [Brevundimonas sp. A19_0]MBO9501936.1 quinone-dependent dihydroorotate dehydrogenase [Brevundimonas sp. A19_0]
MSLLDLGTALLRKMDAERAHEMAIAGLRYLPLGAQKDDPILRTRVAGLGLPNPVGLAAGLDKNAVAIRGLAGLGFGFVECGSVTPRPQTGNPRPRLFRLEEDRAVINRMGFNNDGLDAFADRLAHRPPGVVVGANLGANKDADDRIADYETGLRRLGGLADYLTVNVSSPNTPGLRGLQTVEALEPLLARIQGARPVDRPVFLKIAPDLSDADIGRIVEASLQYGLDGLIVSNTTLDRPDTLRSAHAGEAGGLSGAALKDRARRALAAAAEAADGRLPLIAVGGIADGAEAYARIRAGASAVQIYSALVFEGPGLVRRIKADLIARLKADGFSTAGEAVGTAR